jgi:hypothetical protein
MVNVFADDLEPTLGSELPKLAQLVLRVLVYGADSAIQGGSFHRLGSSKNPNCSA